MKKELIDEISLELLKKGYLVRTMISCFDIIARKEGRILLLKILEDADSVSNDGIETMKKIASYANGVPLIIAEKAGAKLQDNIVYSRLGIFTINLRTFMNSMENRLPFVKSQKAGLVAELVGDKLKQIRENEGLSLKSISRKIGVSSRMISKYENEDAEISVNKALKIYDIFGGKIFKPINIFTFEEKHQLLAGNKLGDKYAALGFDVSDAKKAPFDLISKKDNELILTKVGDDVNTSLDAISKMIGADELVIFKKNKPKGIPALKKEEFLEFKKAKELIKFLRESR